MFRNFLGPRTEISTEHDSGGSMTGADLENELFFRMRKGEEAAFLALYHKLQPPIYRFTLNMTGSPAVAEDITQEVFLAMIGEEFGYLPNRGRLSAYLFGVARKLVLRHLERNPTLVEEDIDSLRSPAPGVGAFSDPMSELLEREGLEELRRAVVSLPSRYREVVVLCDLQEVDYVEAAALLGCPVGTVRSRLHRARALLLDKLQQTRVPRPRVRSLNAIRSLI